jgi:hypothetical protein
LQNGPCLSPKRAGDLRPCHIPDVEIFSAWLEPNETVKLSSAEQVVATGEFTWADHMNTTSQLDVLPGVVQPSEVDAILELIYSHNQNSDEETTFDTDPDTVDGMSTHEIFVRRPDEGEPNVPKGKTAATLAAQGFIKLDNDPLHQALREPLRRSLSAIMDPILEERITPYVRQVSLSPRPPAFALRCSTHPLPRHPSVPSLPHPSVPSSPHPSVPS